MYCTIIPVPIIIMILAYKRLTSGSVRALTTLLLYLHVLISTGNLSIALPPVTERKSVLNSTPKCQALITLSEQLPFTHVTAFSPSILF